MNVVHPKWSYNSESVVKLMLVKLLERESLLLFIKGLMPLRAPTVEDVSCLPMIHRPSDFC